MGFFVITISQEDPDTGGPIDVQYATDSRSIERVNVGDLCSGEVNGFVVSIHAVPGSLMDSSDVYFSMHRGFGNLPLLRFPSRIANTLPVELPTVRIL